MKPFKNFLHILLTFASLLGFLGGWATLAHAQKPAQHNNTAPGAALDPLPPLAPMPGIDSAASSNNNQGWFTIAPQQPSQLRSRQPVFTTGGS